MRKNKQKFTCLKDVLVDRAALRGVALPAGFSGSWRYLQIQGSMTRIRRGTPVENHEMCEERVNNCVSLLNDVLTRVALRGVPSKLIFLAANRSSSDGEPGALFQVRRSLEIHVRLTRAAVARVTL